MLFHCNTTCYLVMPKIVFKNVEISYTSEVKFLGINISNGIATFSFYTLSYTRYHAGRHIRIDICVFVGPCHHGMARPQVGDGGTASDMEGSCE